MANYTRREAFNKIAVVLESVDATTRAEVLAAIHQLYGVTVAPTPEPK